MWTTSERFRATLPHDHQVVQRVEVLDSYDNPLVDLTSRGVYVDGEVTVSRSAIQREGRVQLVDLDGSLTPGDIDELLTPAGNQIRLWRGVQFPGTSDAELVPVGTFRFVKTRVQNRRISLDEMYDRAWIVQGARTTQVMNIGKGAVVTQVIDQILTTAYPGVPLNLPDTDEVTNAGSFEIDSDPWQIAQDFAANIGMRLYFDALGVGQMSDEPDPEEDPVVWEFDDTDSDNMMLVGAAQDWLGTSFNAVAAVGENSSLPAPVRYVAYDLNPRSPTRWGGPYGRRPTVIRDEKIASVAQAKSRAVKELRANTGLFQQATLPSMVNPAFESGDIVYASSPSSGIAQYFILDAFNVPMGANSSMNLNTRARQAVVF